MVGYARVSTGGQNLKLQTDALKAVGVTKAEIFTDKVSGSTTARPGLDRCLQAVQPGDTLLVWGLDRLGRSLRHLVDLVEDLRQRGIGFKSICDGAIDTTTVSGELIFNVFASPAQFERRLIQERTKAGLAVARARGRNGGRPRIPADDPRVVMARRMHGDRSMPVVEICRTLGRMPTLAGCLEPPTSSSGLGPECRGGSAVVSLSANFQPELTGFAVTS